MSKLQEQQQKQTQLKNKTVSKQEKLKLKMEEAKSHLNQDTKLQPAQNDDKLQEDIRVKARKCEEKCLS